MNKQQWKKEYRKWRQFRRGMNNMYHGQGDKYFKLESSEATNMAWDILNENAPKSVRNAIFERHNVLGYYELNTRISRAMFHVHCLLNMQLPNSYRREQC